MEKLYQIALGLAGLCTLLGLVARFIVPAFGEEFVGPGTYVQLTQMFLLWAIALMLLDRVREPGEEPAAKEKAGATE